MRTSYQMVSTIVDSATKYDLEALVDLIERADADVLADTIAFVVTTLFNTLSVFEQRRVRNLLLDDIARAESLQLELRLGET